MARRLAAVATALFVLGHCSAALAQDFWVAPDGDDSWSGQIPEPAADGSDGPFATIARARDAVRSQIAGGMTGDVVVQIGAGQHVLSETLELGPDDSGRDGHVVVYRGQPGEVAAIRGGRPIEGPWEDRGGGLFRAQIGAGLQIHTLYEDGARASEARHPDSGYSLVEALAGSDTRRRFHYAPGDVPGLESLGGLEVEIWPGGDEGVYNWYERVRGVAAIDAGERLVTLDEEVDYSLGPGSRYFVEGRLELLDAPGEFHYDPDGGWLYYRPLAGSPEGVEIVAPSVTTLVHFAGRSENDPVRSIRLEGLDLVDTGTGPRHTGTGAVFATWFAQDIELRGCHFARVGTNAIRLGVNTHRITARDNLIHDIGEYGILAIGGGIDESSGHSFDDNHIHHVGQLLGHGSGIELRQVSESSVSHNLIHDSPRYAVAITADSRYEDPASNFARDNVIGYNDVSRTMQDSQDGGPIYLWGFASGNVIRNNYVHDSVQPFSFGDGIYLDDGVDSTTVEDNVVCNLSAAPGAEIGGVINVKGMDNVFVNNVLKNNVATDAVRAAFAYWHDPPAPVGRHVFQRNIFYSTSQVYEYEVFRWTDDRFASVAGNIYFPVGREWLSRRRFADPPPEDLSFADWQDLTAADGTPLGLDADSLVADPLFVDPASCDVRLSPDSPARDLGFEDVDVGAAGLEDGFPFVESCEDSGDEDRDGAADCADSDCAGAPACRTDDADGGATDGDAGDGDAGGADGGRPVDAGGARGDDGGRAVDTGSGEGCGCATGGSAGALGTCAALAVWLIAGSLRRKAGRRGRRPARDPARRASGNAPGASSTP